MNSPSLIRIAQAVVMAVALSAASLAMAEPSLNDVNQALKSGNIAQAEHLMKEVIEVNPKSAKAHFKYSEILAAEGRIGAAKTELAKAEQIEPGLAFATPQAVNNLKQKLGGDQSTGSSGKSSNLALWALLAVVAFFIFMMVRANRRPAAQTNANYATNPQTPNGYGPQGGGFPQQNPQGGGMGSGIMGGLATGAAIGAGVVAGEMLMHKVLDGDHSNTADTSQAHNEPAPDYSDISGNDFVDNNNSWDNDSYGSSFDSDSDNSGDWS